MNLKLDNEFISVIEYIFLDNGEEFEVEDKKYKIIDEGRWEDNGKYQTLKIIIQDLSTEKYYSIGQTRSGSYFTDYNYEFDSIAYEVRPVEVTKIDWVIVEEK